MTTLNPEEQEEYNTQDCWEKEEYEPSTLIKTVQKYMAEKPDLDHLSALIASLKQPSAEVDMSEKQRLSLRSYFSLVFLAYDPHEEDAKEIGEAWLNATQSSDAKDPAFHWLPDVLHPITASEFEQQAVIHMSGLVAVAEEWNLSYKTLLPLMQECLEKKEDCKDVQGDRLDEFNLKLAKMTSILDRAYNCLAILFEKGRVRPENAAKWMD
jgi:hypothetical protein